MRLTCDHRGRVYQRGRCRRPSAFDGIEHSTYLQGDLRDALGRLAGAMLPKTVRDAFASAQALHDRRTRDVAQAKGAR